MAVTGQLKCHVNERKILVVKFISTELIQKYLEGQANVQEEAQVEAYFHSLAKGPDYTSRLSSEDKKQLEDRLLHRIQQQIFEKQQPVEKVTRWRTIYIQAAATVALILVALAGRLYLQLKDKVILTTANGQVATYILPDNSKVTLNGNSILEYTRWNNRQNRHVTLRGEAYFSVTHTKNHQKFIVNVPGKMQVEVLGTEFNVTNRKNNSRVVLTSGKVRVRLPAAPQEIVMKPGEMVELQPYTRTIAKTKVNPAKYSSWSNRLLVLDKTRLSELIEILENAYGLQVIVSDTSLLNHTFSGKLPKQDVEMLLVGLSKSFDLKITRYGNHVAIEK